MAEALVSTTLEQITNIGEMKLIVGANELQKLNENLAGIRVLLEDAEKKQVVDRGVNEWLNKLQGICYDTDDVLDEWNTTTAQKLQLKEVENASNLWRKVRSHVFSQSFGSKQVFLRQTSALIRIKEINKALDQIVKEQHDFNFRSTMGTQVEQEMSSPVTYLPKVVGKDYDKTAVVNYLLNESSQVSTIPIISIVGMIGIENTTLAQLVVNDDKVKDNFHTIIWVSVLKTFDEIMVAKAILTSLKEDVAPNLDNLKNLLGEIRQCVESKKFLLVLEDVWIEIPKTWQLFKHALSGSQGSGILVTTSTIKSAKIMGTTKMILLGNEWQSSLLLSRQTQFPRSNSEDKKLDVEFWSLLCKVAFSTMTCDESEHLSPLFENMLGSCNGLPSAVMILGSLLSLKTKSREWESVDRELSELEKIKNEFPTPLLLSYIELPSKLKKCFSYCAIFPKDFVINKDNLIRLWMAQGYLKVSGRADLELVGEEYFAILAMRHFFHDFERSVYDGSIMRCKMPHIVQDFAKFLMEKECLNLIDDGPSKSQLEVPYVEARHAMVLVDNIDVSYTYSKLRSLVVKNKKLGVDLSILFDRLTCLRALDLSDCSIKIIPRNINKLMHLRYLNLSHNKKLEELPETVCELYNLQTLDLRNCSGLQKLPNKIGNLVNLRHLINHQTCISYMPRGIERLTCLQTLTKFVVSDGSSNEKGSFECLANLKQLKGFLSITGLGYVRDGEIKKGELADYKNLYGLSLRFDGWTNDDDEGLFKTFDLPPNIEELVIQCYTGKTMPSDWIDKLGKLRMLKLLSCFEFKDFSELGKLSSLESLIICNMKSVKRVDNVLFGRDTDVTSSSTPNTSIAFPKLKYLKLWNMLAWEELKWSRSSKSKSVKIMPCLRYLVIDSCPKLKSLSPLGELPSLESLIIKRLNVKRPGNEFLGAVSSASSAVSNFPELRNLEFEDMREWEEWDVKWEKRVMPNLLSLKFHSCHNLVALPDDLLQRPALQKLVINECSFLEEKYLKETGKDWYNVSHIPFIQFHSHIYVNGMRFSLSDVPKLDPELLHPPDQGVTNSSDSLSDKISLLWNMLAWEELKWSRSSKSKSVKIMPCLRYLVIDSCPKLKSLSPLGELPSLESLIIKRLNVKRPGNEFLGAVSSASSAVSNFPELRNLEFEDMREWEEWDVKWEKRVMPNLLSLKFHSCHNLVALPDDLLQRPALQKLVINECSFLEEKYLKETGKDWYNVSHIPFIQFHSHIYVNGMRFSLSDVPKLDPELLHPPDQGVTNSSDSLSGDFTSYELYTSSFFF